MRWQVRWQVRWRCHLRRLALEAAGRAEVVAGGAGALVHPLVHRLGQVRGLAHTPAQIPFFFFDLFMHRFVHAQIHFLFFRSCVLPAAPVGIDEELPAVVEGDLLPPVLAAAGADEGDLGGGAQVT